MSKLILFFCFSQVSNIVGGAPPRILRSPCPDIFSYEKFHLREGHPADWIFPSEDHRWRGVVMVPPSLPIFLKIKLLVPAVLLSKYAGRIELARDKTEIVKRIKSGSLEEIKYHVFFPAKIPIPEVLLIEVNSRIICSQPLVPRRLKTILTLEHSLMPLPTNVTFRDGIGGNNHRKQTSEKDFPEKESSGCGRRSLKGSVTSGKASVSIGDWPWMVPLFRRTELGLQFLCSSTLISFEFVVTAAHCLRFKDLETTNKEDIVAYVGRVDIKNWTEENTQPRELSQIFIHPDFNPNTLHSDLALLKFSKPVRFSPQANPACLWEGDDDLSAVVGRKGVVFGWGTDGSGRKITPTPNLAVMPIVSQEECLRSKDEFVYLTSNRTLCAGFRNGTGPCNGDSGGGLLLPRKNEDGDIRWVLRGVVSLSLLEDSQMMCDTHEYTVFTDVAKYQDWIAGIVSVKE